MRNLTTMECCEVSAGLSADEGFWYFSFSATASTFAMLCKEGIAASGNLAPLWAGAGGVVAYVVADAMDNVYHNIVD